MKQYFIFALILTFYKISNGTQSRSLLNDVSDRPCDVDSSSKKSKDVLDIPSSDVILPSLCAGLAWGFTVGVSTPNDGRCTSQVVDDFCSDFWVSSMGIMTGTTGIVCLVGNARYDYDGGLLLATGSKILTPFTTGFGAGVPLGMKVRAAMKACRERCTRRITQGEESTALIDAV